MSTWTSSAGTTSRLDDYSGGRSKTVSGSDFWRPQTKVIDPKERCVHYRLDQEQASGYWVVHISKRRARLITERLEDVGEATDNRSVTYFDWGDVFREKAPADITWATKALELQEKPTHSELVSVVSGISKLIAERNIAILAATLNDLLKDPKLRLDVMIAALRGSFPARSQMAQWKELVSLAHQRVVKLGRNPDSLLRGLN